MVNFLQTVANFLSGKPSEKQEAQPPETELKPFNNINVEQKEQEPEQPSCLNEPEQDVPTCMEDIYKRGPFGDFSPLEKLAALLPLDPEVDVRAKVQNWTDDSVPDKEWKAAVVRFQFMSWLTRTGCNGCLAVFITREGEKSELIRKIPYRDLHVNRNGPYALLPEIVEFISTHKGENYCMRVVFAVQSPDENEATGSDCRKMKAFFKQYVENLDQIVLSISALSGALIVPEWVDDFVHEEPVPDDHMVDDRVLEGRCLEDHNFLTQIRGHPSAFRKSFMQEPVSDAKLVLNVRRMFERRLGKPDNVPVIPDYHKVHVFKEIVRDISCHVFNDFGSLRNVTLILGQDDFYKLNEECQTIVNILQSRDVPVMYENYVSDSPVK